ncbi:MAG: TonB-dependent receptor [Acidobacteriaceae bacterium]
MVTLPLSAQSAVDGSIRGTVTDRNGAVVPGTAVEVRNLGTNATTRIRADTRGNFHAEHLAPGVYNVHLHADGFNPYTAQNVAVELGRATGLHPQLAAGGGTTAIVVQGTPDAPQLDSSAFASNITQSDLRDMPINGRRWSTFALLSPAANSITQGNGQISFRGLSPAQNSYTLDGADDNQAFTAEPRGGNRIAYGFSQDAVREFQVDTSNYSARYGHAAGGVVNTVSKSGSNQTHGSLFYYVRDNVLAATNPFDQISVYNAATNTASSRYVKPQDVRQQWGGTLGGAIVHNKLFYFYSYDQQHKNFPAVSAPLSPTFFQDVNFALLKKRGLTQAEINDALLYINNLTGVVPRQGNQIINFPKLDWQVNDHNHLSLQYNRVRWSSPGGVHTAPVVHYGATSLGNDFVKTDSVLARWLLFLSRNVSNDLRYQHARDFEYELAQKPSPEEPTTGPNGLPPQVSFGYEGITFGTPVTLNRFAYPDERRQQFSDTLTWARGRNVIHLGFDYNHVHEYSNYLRDTEGSYSYRYSNNGLEDWITDFTYNASAYPTAGCPNGISFTSSHYFCYSDYTQGFGLGIVKFATNDYAAFLQTNWKLRKNLTVNFGVRYEYEHLPAPQHSNPVLDAAFAEFGSTSRYPRDKNNYGPRIGFSWAPGSKRHLVVRAGYGLYYGRILNATIKSALLDTALADPQTGLPQSDFHILVTPKTITSSPTCMNSGIALFGYPCTFPVYPSGNAARTTTSAVMFDKHFQSPMMQQFHLSLERELKSKTTLSASYLMTLSRQLANAVDVNIAPATSSEVFQLKGAPPHPHRGTLDGETFLVPVYTARRNPQFGPMTDILSNSTGSYNALILRARQRMVHGVEFHLQWTWSKALDFGQSASVGYRGNHQFDPFNIRYDKALSSYNRPHKILLSMVLAPQLHLQNHLLQQTVRDWELMPIFVEVSGRPYTYNISGGTSLLGGYRSINGSGGARYLPTIGRNTLRLPDTQNLDVRLARNFHLGEKYQLVAMAEGFNLLNHVNYSGLVTTAYRPGTAAEGLTRTTLVFQDAAAIAATNSSRLPFGQYTSAGSSQQRERQLQFALRLRF